MQCYNLIYIIYVSADSDTAKVESPNWLVTLNNLERLFLEFAKADENLLERFSNDKNSVAVILPDSSNLGLPMFGGIIGGGIESINQPASISSLLIDLSQFFTGKE